MQLEELKFHPHISNHQYHHELEDYISCSRLKKHKHCPAATLVETEESDALNFGAAMHPYILEPDDFLNQVAVCPDINKRTNAGKEEFAAFQQANQGKIVITKSEMETLVAMQNSVYAHPMAKRILSEGMAEQTVLWTDPDTGIKCKCRPDWIPAKGWGTVVDLKSCADASEYGFLSNVRKYGYDIQAGMYTEGCNQVAGDVVFDAFLFIAVEKTAPYRTEVYLLDSEWLAYGRTEYFRLLNLELECRKSGLYPAYQNPEITTLFKPAYL